MISQIAGSMAALAAFLASGTPVARGEETQPENNPRRTSYLSSATKAGYGYQKASYGPKAENSTATLNGVSAHSGCVLSGNFGLGYYTDYKDEFYARQRWFNIVNPRIDALIGADGNNYFRHLLDLGPSIKADRETEDGRSQIGMSLLGRWEYARIGLPGGQTLISRGWYLVTSFLLGVGGWGILLNNETELIIGFHPATLQLRNQSALSYRVYANHPKAFLNSVDLYASYEYDRLEMGACDVRNRIYSLGLSIALL